MPIVLKTKSCNLLTVLRRSSPRAAMATMMLESQIRGVPSCSCFRIEGLIDRDARPKESLAMELPPAVENEIPISRRGAKG